MKPHATIVIVVIAILVLAVVAWNWSSHETSGDGTVSSDRNRQPISERAAASDVPRPVIGSSQSKYSERDETQPNRHRTAHVAEAIASVTPQVQELLRTWELKSFRPLKFANTLLQSGDSSAAAIVIPPPDEETEGKLRDLLLAEIDDPSFELTTSEIEKLKGGTGWPRHSRIVVALADSDAGDGVLVLENADEKNVSVDPVTGSVSMGSDGAAIFSKVDLDSRNHYSHLFGVKSVE